LFKASFGWLIEGAPKFAPANEGGPGAPISARIRESTDPHLGIWRHFAPDDDWSEPVN
jgi:hypothetical protein